MTSLPKKQLLWSIGIGLLVAAAAAAYFGVPEVRDRVAGWLGAKAKADETASNKNFPAKLIVRDKDEQGNKLRPSEIDYSLQLNKEAVESLELNPTPAILADKKLPLPPMIGTVNFDPARMFLIRPRFQGEVAELLEVEYSDYPQGPKKKRPLRFGDRVEQGKDLAILWCRDLGEKKAALVDAICSLQLSSELLDTQLDIFYQGAGTLQGVKLAKRQVQSDINTWRTAERTLKMWKLSNEEVREIIDEAKLMIDRNADAKEEAKYLLHRKLQTVKDGKLPDDPKQARDAEIINKWARVPQKVPVLPDAPGRRLTVVEKNTNRTDMVDPGRDTPLFRLADMSRLQIWVHPPEEYLSILRDRLKEGPGGLKWEVKFQADPSNSPTEPLNVEFVSPSLEPNQHTPMLVGYLDNKDEKYLVGQFVTATIRVPPPVDQKGLPATVEIPTEAINYLQGQNLVFVANPKVANQFTLRRVAVVQSAKNVSLVRMEPTEEENKMANAEIAKGRYPFRPLRPGDRVITRGVVELTEALENLRGIDKENQQKENE